MSGKQVGKERLKEYQGVIVGGGGDGDADDDDDKDKDDDFGEIIHFPSSSYYYSY